MTNSNLNMQSPEDNKTIALNLKDIEQDTMAMDENDKNDSKGNMNTDFQNMDSRCISFNYARIGNDKRSFALIE